MSSYRKKINRLGMSVRAALITAAALGLGLTAALIPGQSPAQIGPAAPLSLKDVAVPEPTNLHAFLKGTPGSLEAADAKRAAIQLGKALFWDMQVGSDNIQACASCHFNAGADSRGKNQLDPGSADGGDAVFGNSKIPGVPGPNDAPWNFGFGPNATLMGKHFPLHRRQQPHEPGDGFGNPNVILDTNDIVSSQGVRLGDTSAGTGDYRDTTFNYRDRNVRRSAPRNAPSAINAGLHVDMFWDGRGSFIFNGQTPFGFRDSTSQVKRHFNGVEQLVTVRIPYASYASQAVGPPLSLREMSGHSRNFSDLASKLLAPALVPLGLQVVDSTDSVLGSISRGAALGLNTSYRELILAAFRPDWTGPQNTAQRGADTMLVHNFPLYFGLALQMYQSTLISDDTPFDQYMGARAAVRQNGQAIAGNPNALTAEEKRGLDLYTGAGRCVVCHVLPETSNHIHRLAGHELRKARKDRVLGPINGPNDPINEVAPQAMLELMPMGNGGMGVYDVGFYNIGVRPTTEDIGRASAAPSGLPLSYAALALMKRNKLLPADVAPYVPDRGRDELGNVLSLDQLFAAAGNRVVDRGAFKTPILRNQELQGPYFHNGSDATLRHVVEFYARGGNFPGTNRADLDADISYIPELDPRLGRPQGDDIRALVAFLSRGLTDPRVTYRRAPFDHPQLWIPVGEKAGSKLPESFIELPATGASGNRTPLSRFLGLDPQSR